MKKRAFIGIFLVIAFIGLIYMIVVSNVFHKNKEMIKEYVPEVEISDSELRKTFITLYFADEEGELQSENRLIDSKELLRNPYITLVGMLLEGPKDSKLKTIIPEGTKIIDAKLNKKCVTINLSKEFVEKAEGDTVEKCKMIYTIVNTLTELNEVQSVKFLIEGEKIDGFEGDAIKLTNEFVRTDF